MIQPWSVFYDEVMPHLPGCELPIAENAIRNAAIEFCKKSLILQVDLDAFTTVAGQSTYDLAYDANLGVTKIVSGRWSAGTGGSGRLWPTSPDVLDQSGIEWETLTGSPSNYYLIDPDQVRLVRIPESEVTINLKCAMKPLRASTGIEGFMVERYKEDIAAGALGRLMSMPGKPFTNLQLGGYQNTQFQAAITRARSEAMRGFTRQPLFVQNRS